MEKFVEQNDDIFKRTYTIFFTSPSEQEKPPIKALWDMATAISIKYAKVLGISKESYLRCVRRVLESLVREANHVCYLVILVIL